MGNSFQFFALFAILVIEATSFTAAFRACSSPSAREGHHDGLVGSKECVDLVQKYCKPIGHTSTWRKGLRVKGNCDRIPLYSAVATFLGPGGSYNAGGHGKQHTGILVACDEARGFTLYDQFNAARGVIRKRFYPWKNTRPSNSGQNFYAIA